MVFCLPSPTPLQDGAWAWFMQPHNGRASLGPAGTKPVQRSCQKQHPWSTQLHADLLGLASEVCSQWNLRSAVCVSLSLCLREVGRCLADSGPRPRELSEAWQWIHSASAQAVCYLCSLLFRTTSVLLWWILSLAPSCLHTQEPKAAADG